MVHIFSSIDDSAFLLGISEFLIEDTLVFRGNENLIMIFDIALEIDAEICKNGFCEL